MKVISYRASVRWLAELRSRVPGGFSLSTMPLEQQRHDDWGSGRLRRALQSSSDRPIGGFWGQGLASGGYFYPLGARYPDPKYPRKPSKTLFLTGFPLKTSKTPKNTKKSCFWGSGTGCPKTAKIPQKWRILVVMPVTCYPLLTFFWRKSVFDIGSGSQKGLFLRPSQNPLFGGFWGFLLIFEVFSLKNSKTDHVSVNAEGETQS